MSGANVKVWYHIPPVEVDSIAMTNVSGVTDGNGTFAVTRRTGSIEVMCEAEKAGYYPAGRTHEFAKFSEEDQARLRPTVTLLLKKVGKPVPMYAKSVNLGVPIFDEATGFDLAAGDWIAPYGKGTSTDILFTGELVKEGGASNYKLRITFPNPGDGIQEFRVPEVERGSTFRSPHEAPLEGYESAWIQTDNRMSGRPPETNRDPNRNFFLRVRTVMDERGRIKSALYGKIYGDFMQFRYYLNPSPNDRNLEFDPKQNLLKNLKSFERVHAP
jgi:hypothetical protein